MKKILLLFLSVNLLLVSPSIFGETSALNELLKEKADAARAAEQNSDSARRLNQEKKILIDRLLDVNKQYDEVTKTQNKKREFNPITISLNEIAGYIEGASMGRCRITPGDHPGEYVIQREKIKIRFAFLPNDSLLSPKLSLTKGVQNEDVLQLEQQGYNPNLKTSKGEMKATLRFNFREGTDKLNEVIHAVFKGQRLEDKWFGNSSYEFKTITCATEK